MLFFDLMQIKAFAFDLDGTIYTGDTLVDGAADLVLFLKDRGLRVFFFTNGSARTRQQVREKLGGFGIEAGLDEIYTSAFATAKWLSDRGVSLVFCLGGQGLRDELAGFGVEITENTSDAEALVIGLDTSFSYQTLSAVMSFKNDRRPLIACNRDANYPVSESVIRPGCGALVSAVEAALERAVDYAVGKPNCFMFELLCADWGLAAHEVAVVGDSVSSDIAMACKAGAPSFLFSAQTAEEEETVVLERLAQIKGFFEGRGSDED